MARITDAYFEMRLKAKPLMCIFIG